MVAPGIVHQYRIARMQGALQDEQQLGFRNWTSRRKADGSLHARIDRITHPENVAQNDFRHGALFPADPVSALAEDCGNRGCKSAARIRSTASGGSLAPTGGGTVHAVSIAPASRNSAAPLAGWRKPLIRTSTLNENRHIDLGPTAHNKHRKNLAPVRTLRQAGP
jgi:hypothetical protein